mmetsp:Transcript_35391/g.82750  ORF Transcript_35391/g.82750 Transcript_35391/m.82750 type:complete len:233 (-) Transcript_35391:273-971(-)
MPAHHQQIEEQAMQCCSLQQAGAGDLHRAQSPSARQWRAGGLLGGLPTIPQPAKHTAAGLEHFQTVALSSMPNPSQRQGMPCATDGWPPQGLPTQHAQHRFPKHFPLGHCCCRSASRLWNGRRWRSGDSCLLRNCLSVLPRWANTSAVLYRDLLQRLLLPLPAGMRRSWECHQLHRLQEEAVRLASEPRTCEQTHHPPQMSPGSSQTAGNIQCHRQSHSDSVHPTRSAQHIP